MSIVCRSKSLLPIIALLAAGCDRQSAPPAQQPRDTALPAAAAKAGTIDRSHKGSELPEMTFADPAGKTLRLTSLKGRPVLVNLWATWCTPCIAELPQLDALAASGAMRVVTISQDMGKPDAVPAFLAKRGVKRLEPWLDPENDLSFHFGTGTLPTSVLYDAQGREVWRVVGELDWTGPEAAKLLGEAGS